MITSSDPVDDAAQGCCSIELSISNSTTDETDVDSDEELFYDTGKTNQSIIEHIDSKSSDRKTAGIRIKKKTQTQGSHDTTSPISIPSNRVASLIIK